MEAADEAGQRAVSVFARSADAAPDAPWTRHASGTAGPASARAPEPATLGQWPPAGAVEQDLAGFYPELAGAGLGYGPAFQGVRAAWRRDEEIFAEVALPEGTPVAGFGVHPALLDAALQVIGLGVGSGLAGTAVRLDRRGGARVGHDGGAGAGCPGGRRPRRLGATGGRGGCPGGVGGFAGAA